MPVSLGETMITRATCASMIRATSHAFPHTSKTTRSSEPRLAANNSKTSRLPLTRRTTVENMARQPDCYETAKTLGAREPEADT